MQRISRRNFIAALLIVLVWLGFVISGSHALLNASASLTGNTLTTGSAGLLISNAQDPNPSLFDASVNGFSLSENPGDIQDHYFTLKNASSAGIALNIDMTVATSEQQLPLAAMVTLDVVPVDDSGDPLPNATAAGGTLNALGIGSHVKLSGFIPENSTQRYRLRTMVAQEDTQPNESITYDLIFTGTQRIT